MIQNKVKTLNNKYSNYYNQITNDEKKIFLIFFVYTKFLYKIIIISIKELEII